MRAHPLAGDEPGPSRDTDPAMPSRERIVVLAGRQNSGKTSLLMHLTGTTQRPVNFPGTSVERSESTVAFEGRSLRCVDIPGIGSLVPISPDERVAVEYLESLRGPSGRDVVILPVLDASKLSVELHLFRMLARLSLPMAVVLTKLDVAKARGQHIDTEALADALGVPVIPVDGIRGDGVDVLLQTLATRTFPRPSGDFDPQRLAEHTVREPGTTTITATDRIDAVLLHPVFGLPIAAIVVFAIFQAIFSGADPFIGLIESGQEAVGGWVSSGLSPGALRSFAVDGLVNGVGSVLVFLPQIVLLIALVTALEASGYMARVAFLLDRVLHRVGLSGRSFVPLVSSFACAIPGILATRIIDNERDRLATIAVAPLMSCSARLPVYVLLVGAFFPASLAGLVLFSMYLLGIVLAAIVATLLRKTVLHGGTSPLLMELPAYQRPSGAVVWGQVKVAARSFLVLAGTVIFAATIVIWALSYYPRPLSIHEEHEAQRAELAAPGNSPDAEAALAAIDAREGASYLEQSYLARFGKAVQPLFAPAGFDWRITVGLLSAFPAREVIVPTLGVLYAVGDVDTGSYDLGSLDHTSEPDSLRDRLRSARDPEGNRTFTPLVALSLMVFFALCSQCVSTLGTIRQETRSWRWPVFVFAYMTVLAWLGAVCVYQLGQLWVPA